MKRLIIYGTGLIAEVADFYFRKDTNYDVVCFTNADEFIQNKTFLDKPLISLDNLEEKYSPEDNDIFVAIGYSKTNQVRAQRYRQVKERGYRCASYISPLTTYFGTPVGDNCFILENNVIQPFVSIGNNVTLWSGNHIGHHSVVKDHCFISSHVVVSGSCHIEENCFIGVNATIRDSIRIGRYSVIGSGAVVMKNCNERSLVRPPASDYTVVTKDVI